MSRLIAAVVVIGYLVQCVLFGVGLLYFWMSLFGLLIMMIWKQYTPKWQQPKGSKLFEEKPVQYIAIVILHCLVFMILIKWVHMEMHDRAVDVLNTRLWSYRSSLLFPYRHQTCLNTNVGKGMWPNEVNWKSIIVWFSWWVS